VFHSFNAGFQYNKKWPVNKINIFRVNSNEIMLKLQSILTSGMILAVFILKMAIYCVLSL